MSEEKLHRKRNLKVPVSIQSEVPFRDEALWIYERSPEKLFEGREYFLESITGNFLIINESSLLYIFWLYSI